MAYLTQSDLEIAVGGPQKLVELADLDEDGIADATAITSAIVGASTWIDQALAVRYATPIANPSSSLKRFVTDEAIYILRKARRMVTEFDVTDHKERIVERENFRKGLIRPDEPLPSKSSATRAGWVDRNDGSDDMLKRSDFDGEM